MAQLDTGSPGNYTIGGIRLFFNETLSNGDQRGLMYLGNIVSAQIASEIDELEHFSAQTGTRIRDRSLTREVSFTIPFTFDEPNTENLNFMFFGGETFTDVAADTSTGSTEQIIMSGTAPRFVSGLRNSSATAITGVVLDPGGAATPMTEGTDYNIQIVGKMQAIVPIAGGGISDGDTIEVTFDNDNGAAKQITVLDKTERQGAALLQAVSDVGNEFEWNIPKASFRPNGDITYNDEDWSEFEGVLEVIADTVNNPTEPYGTIKHYGTENDL